MITNKASRSPASLVLLAGLLVGGCAGGSSSDASHEAAHEAPAEAAHKAAHEAPAEAKEGSSHEAHAAAATGLKLQLNDGARWEMDEHTRVAFGSIRETLASAKLSSPEDIAALAETLAGQQKELISGCTMKGASHDQLHVFLMVWMPAVKDLGLKTELAEGQEALEILRGHVAEYDKHFE